MESEIQKPKAEIRVLINGEARHLAAGTTISSMLDLLRLPRKGVAVELNRTIVPRSSHDARVLLHGDEVEIVTFVGGG